jgi:diguanylate cyclase (GGDEF)-like protein
LDRLTVDDDQAKTGTMEARPEHDMELRQLRALLGMSRELLQSDDTFGMLALAGRAMAELTRPRSALLVVCGDTEQVVEFDDAGRPRPASRRHPRYAQAIALLGGGRQAGPDAAAQHIADPHTLALGVPARAAAAAMVVDWDAEAGAREWAERRRILTTVLELALAAMGRIQVRSSLERLVSTQYEQMADTAQTHANELARRDMAVEEMRMLSLTDVLTGLDNRRGFFVHAEHVFKVAQRRHATSAVIFADIDGLKLVNDELGHDAGDSLICDAAAVFRESFRTADVTARIGGDEFVAYTLDDTRPDVILGRLQDNLRAFNLMQERPYRVDLSAGIVQCDPASGQDLLDYVMLADRQMYVQKQRRLH